MLRPKKIHTRNLITKKIPVARKFPTPHNFSNGPSLTIFTPLISKESFLLTHTKLQGQGKF